MQQDCIFEVKEQQRCKKTEADELKKESAMTLAAEFDTSRVRSIPVKIVSVAGVSLENFTRVHVFI